MNKNTNHALESGKRYKIKGFNKDINQNYKYNLLSMGLIPGTEFLVKRFAPFSRTAHIQLEQFNQYNLSLRENELSSVILDLVY